MQSSSSWPNAAAEPRGASPGGSVGVFLALSAAVILLSRASTALLRYPDRAIGFGLMEGVDPARRFPLYLVLVGLMLAVWLACQYGARLLASKRPSWFLGVRSRLENDVCALFAAVGSVAIVTRVFADRLDGLGPARQCGIALAAVMSYALVRRLSPKPSWFPKRLGSPSSLVLALLLAWPGAKIAGVLGDVRGADRAWITLLGTLLSPLLYAAALGHFLRWPGRATRADVERAFALGAAPLFLFPALCPVANEIQHALAQRRVVEPRSVALVLLGALVLMGAASFWRARGGKLVLSPSRVLSRVVFPLTIFGQTLLDVHEHVLGSRQLNPLHDGEQVTAIQQLLEFDKWPFVDIWPAHGLFDYLGALYSLVNGFHPLEITSWNCLLAALSATAAYAVLANLGAPLFAFAVAALLPLDTIMPRPAYSYFYAEPGLLGVGLLACVVISRPSLYRYVLLSGATFLCFFWTPTSGIASIAAVLSLLVLELITTSRDRKPAWQGLMVFAATGAAVAVVYALVLVLRGQPVLETLRLIRAFMQADPLIGGRPTVIERLDAWALFQYVLLPAIGLVYLAQLARHALDRRPLEHASRLLGFLTLVSFVLFARTLTRHGLIERYQPFYFPLLALCAWMPRSNGAALFGAARASVSELASRFWQRAGARAWFCAGLALYLVLVPKPNYRRLVFDAYEFHTWQKGEVRAQPQKETQYPQLKTFMQEVLGPKDTFLELLNTPLLYSLLDREVPAQFFLPTMFYATDGVQDNLLQRLEAFGGSARVPVALSGRKIDKIENSLRSYRISEYVYREYFPFGRLDDIEVWVSRARWNEASAKVTPRPLSFRAPSSYGISSMDPPVLEDGVLHLSAKGTDPRAEDVAEVDGILLGGLESYHGVRLSYRTSVAGTLELFYRFNDGKYNAQSSGHAALSVAAQWQTVEIEIPPLPNPKAALAGLRIDPPDGAELMVKDLALVFGASTAFASQRYNLGMLPFFWGSFDDHRAAETAKLIQAIEVPKDGAPLAKLKLRMNPAPKPGTGNYLKLCLRVPGFSPTKPRTWRAVQHEGSWQDAGDVTLRYGNPASVFTFDLVQPQPNAVGLPEDLVRSFAEGCKTYLVRMSTQYAWNSQDISSITLSSSVPVVVESASLLEGD